MMRNPGSSKRNSDHEANNHANQQNYHDDIHLRHPFFSILKATCKVSRTNDLTRLI
ncbi:MAG TPA: hypothetical protein VEP90_29290 [Methylomirabilota bacterium]|nr:hypothetical protein [Methylomirabilota bacterium]